MKLSELEIVGSELELYYGRGKRLIHMNKYHAVEKGTCRLYHVTRCGRVLDSPHPYYAEQQVADADTFRFCLKCASEDEFRSEIARQIDFMERRQLSMMTERERLKTDRAWRDACLTIEKWIEEDAAKMDFSAEVVLSADDPGASVRMSIVEFIALVFR